MNSSNFITEPNLNGKICTLQLIKSLKFKKTHADMNGRLLKFTTFKNIKLGVSNESASNNQLEREDNAPDYIPESPKGKTWLLYPLLLADTKTGKKEYIKFENWKDLVKMEREFQFDGKIVSSIEDYHDMLLASEWKHYPSYNIGNTIREKLYLAPLLENIVYIQVNGKIYT